MRLSWVRALCALCAAAVMSAAHANTCYVTTTGSNTNLGTSWASPYDLQTALGAGACSEIWVAAGIYKPTAGADRNVNFTVRAGVAVYGGFNGAELNRNQRDPAANLTVLSGDLNGNDTGATNGVDATVPTDNTNQENSYNVVLMDGSITAIASTTVLDGFTITGGNATGNFSVSSQDGGGLFCNGEGGNCSPTLNNLVFSGNKATYGGGLYLFASFGAGSPTLTNLTFSGNMAAAYGGGFYNFAGNPTLTNVTFSGNSAPNGGGGGICNSGASNATLTNVTFSGNTAAFAYGGALYQSGGNVTLNSVILVNDSAGGDPEVHVESGTVALDHGLVWNTVAGSGACPTGATCTNMQYADPKLGALQNNGGFTPTFLPGTGSAAIDNGKDAGCPAADQRGVKRPQGPHCDIGAVEVQRSSPCYVDATATGAGNGYNWTDAYTDLQQALNATGCSEIWVAKGIYKPIAGTDQSVSFYILPGTAVYGGFAGTETSRAQRNPAQNASVLSGDLNGDDTGAVNGIDTSVPTDGTKNDNSTHVVYFDGRTTPITASTVLDGFVVTAGYANGAYPDANGGAMFCNANNGGNGVCSPTLGHLVFSGNSASSSGGAIYDYGFNGVSNPVLSDILFIGNASSGAGGAMYNTCYGAGSASSPTLTSVTFSGNSAGGSGGAMYNNGISNGCESSPALTNVTFGGNSTGVQGGGLANSGYSNTILTNVTFSGNTSSGDGGAMFNYNATSVTLVNVILWGDIVIGGSGSNPEIINISAAPTIDHSIVKGGCPGGSTCTNILTGDPMLGALTNNGGFTPTFLPGATGAAIDAGSDASCPAADQRDVRRPQGLHCDIGAVEVVTDRIFADNFDGTPTP